MESELSNSKCSDDILSNNKYKKKNLFNKQIFRQK